MNNRPANLTCINRRVTFFRKVQKRCETSQKNSAKNHMKHTNIVQRHRPHISKQIYLYNFICTDIAKI